MFLAFSRLLTVIQWRFLFCIYNFIEQQRRAYERGTSRWRIICPRYFVIVQPSTNQKSPLAAPLFYSRVWQSTVFKSRKDGTQNTHFNIMYVICTRYIYKEHTRYKQLRNIYLKKNFIKAKKEKKKVITINIIFKYIEYIEMFNLVLCIIFACVLKASFIFNKIWRKCKYERK